MIIIIITIIHINKRYNTIQYNTMQYYKTKQDNFSKREFDLWEINEIIILLLLLLLAIIIIIIIIIITITRQKFQISL